MSITEKLQKVVDNMQRVRDAGYSDGFETGKQAERDSFWDEFQQNGARTSYGYAFVGWTDGMFKPKHNIIPTGSGGNDMFYKTAITDLKGLLETSGVTLDTSQANSLNYTFSTATNLTTIPYINASSCLSMSATFRDANKLTEVTLLNPNNNCVYDRTFVGCSELREVRFYDSSTGAQLSGFIRKVINSMGLYFGDSPKLSPTSVIHIIGGLGTPTTDTDKAYVKNVVFCKTAYDNAVSYYNENPIVIGSGSFTLTTFINIAKNKGWTITTVDK